MDEIDNGEITKLIAQSLIRVPKVKVYITSQKEKFSEKEIIEVEK